MRTNLALALIFSISGLLLCTLFFIFLNVQIEQEPFTSWSEIPYAGMFHYAGLVSLAGAILYILIETRENRSKITT